MDNRKLGNDFENLFCEILYKNGFWVLRIPQTQAGQPADVIAAKDGKSSLIDCKVVSGKRFVFSRFEENQRNAMQLWSDCGNGLGWIAIKFETTIYMVQSAVILLVETKKKSLTEDELKYYSQVYTLNEWLSFGWKS